MPLILFMNGCAVFFPADSDVFITYKDGIMEQGFAIGFEPEISGGFQREGFLTADGTEEIRLRYDFGACGVCAGQPDEIKKVEFHLQLGNDSGTL